MRAVIQRVTEANVTVIDADGSRRVTGEIGPGLVVLLGVTHTDQILEATRLAEKVALLRIFEDDDGKMNRSVLDVQGEVLVVSQFTLYGDARKGRRPSFVDAAKPEQAGPLYETFVEALAGQGTRVATGEFQTHMQVSLVNDGPVTLLLDTGGLF